MYTDTALAWCAEQKNAGLQQQPTQGGLPLAVPAVPLRLQPHRSSMCPAHVKHITAYVPLHNHMAALPPSKLSGSTSLSEVLFMFVKHFFFFSFCLFICILVTCISCDFPFSNIPYLFFFLLFFCQSDVCKDKASGIHWVKPDVRCRIGLLLPSLSEPLKLK